MFPYKPCLLSVGENMIILIAFVAVIAAVSIFLAVYGKNDNSDYNEDAVIVLGKGIGNCKIPTALVKRLDKAVEYHEKNPEAYIIVSGGKGNTEKPSEAKIMADYLISNGVSERIIIKEDKSTTTYENFVYSKEILKDLFGENYSVAFISNVFHIYRAEKILKSLEIDATHIGAKNDSPTVIIDYLREVFVLFGFLLSVVASRN